MDKLHLDQHISQQYNQELEDIRNKVLAMGGLVEKQATNGLRALVENDGDLATEVSESDYQVNAMEVEIDEECIQVLARRAPTASDLRLIVAVIKVITDLERIGDEAEKLGRFAAELSGSNHTLEYRRELRHLGGLVQSMLHDSLDAFARLDSRMALKVAQRDDDVDVEYDNLTRLLTTHLVEDPRRVSDLLKITWCARALERIGDHSVNICEYVVYLVKGRDIRHTDISAEATDD
jgi:phosphate transport system protein